MVIKITKSHNNNMSNLNTFIKICFFYLLLVLFTMTPVKAHDAECGVWHGEQNALILGTIENIEGPECSILVSEALPCPKGADYYKMLPLKDIPSNVIVDMNNYSNYYMSYNKRKEFKIGDYVILAVDKVNKNWRLVYSPCEVSSLDSKTLEFLPEDKKTSMSTAWEEFIHSKGEVNNFAFRGSELLVKYSKADSEYKKIFPKENNENEPTINTTAPKPSTVKGFSTWIKDSSSILDYSWTLPIIILVVLLLVISKRSNSKI